MNSQSHHSGNTICGREYQQQQLLEAFRRRNNGPLKQELVLLTGPSGCGKTVLAKSLARRTEAERGYFCWGKCDQMQHCNEPFAPFNTAITQLVETVIKRDDTGEETERLEEAIEQATKDTELGVTLLTSLFGVFRKVLQDGSSLGMSSSWAHGLSSKSNDNNNTNNATNNNNGTTRPQTTGNVQHHAGSATESPAIVLFCNFLKAFCCVQHPVVLLLDDWQWLDQSSLELLKVLGSTENNIPGFMILGTCRGNEVSVHDPLSVVLRDLEVQNVQITNIELEALSVKGAQDMIISLLGLPKTADTSSFQLLAQQVHQLTGGNPFFIQQSLRVLRDRKVVYRNSTGSWKWDDEFIMATHDDDGQEWERTKMLNSEIRRLADTSLAMEEALIIASFLGARFSQRHVEVVASSNPSNIQEAINTLVNDGVFQREDGVLEDSSGDDCFFRWRHDKYQQASSALLPEEKRTEYSVGLGRKLLSSLQPREIDVDAYLIANLFLQDLSLLVDCKERTKVARLLEVAGVKAASSSAFESAVAFFSQGIALLPKEPWQAEYGLCLALHNGAIEMELCAGRFQQLEKLFDTVIENTKRLEDQLRACEAKILSFSARHLDAEAVQLGFKVLKQLGEPFPRRAISLHTGIALVKTMLWLRRTSTEDILKTPPMQRWDKQAAQRILQIICAAMIRCKPDCSPLWAIRGVEISMKYGFSSITPVTFTALGMILGTTVLSLAEDAKRLVQIGQMIDQRYHAPEYLCRITVFRYSYAETWHAPFLSCMEPQLHGMRAGLLSGDVEAAYIQATFYSFHGFCVGIKLKDLVKVMEEQYKEFSKLKQKMPFVGMFLELGKGLLLTDTGTDLDQFGAYCDKETNLDEAHWGRKDNALLVISCFCQLFLSVYINDYREGLRVSKRILRLPFDQIYGAMAVVQIHFLVGMTHVLAAHAGRRKPRFAGLRSLRRLRALHSTMTWKENVLSKIHLLEAERSVFKGDKETASRKFDSAIVNAEESGFIHEAALARERFAFAFSQWGMQDEASKQRTEAAILYQKWGFNRRAAQLTMSKQ